MPQYHAPGLAQSKALDATADGFFTAGAAAGANADKYVRVTVFLASVLFLVGSSTHFPVLSARYGLVSVAGLLLAFSLIQLVQLPRPPGDPDVHNNPYRPLWMTGLPTRLPRFEG